MFHTIFVTAAVLVGLGVGAAAGWLGVALERIEKLEAEEREERATYERELAGGTSPVAPWQGERYGWTWLERLLAPMLGGGLFGLFASHEGGLGLVIHLVWMALFVHIVVFDLKHRLILNRVTYPAVGLALVLSPISPGLTVGRALVGAIVVSLFFGLQYVISRGGIGLGDAKLGALVGAVTGLSFDGLDYGALYAVLWAVILGGAVALALLGLRIRGLKDPIPYGPFLCAGAALILYQGL